MNQIDNKEGMRKFLDSTGVTLEDLVREKRNELLAKTDWRVLPDYVGNDQEQWIIYRQALRDFPQNQNPDLDENGDLTNTNWPIPPGSNQWER